MSTVLTKVIVDCSTGEERIEPLTPEEITELNERAAQAAIRQAQAELEAEEKANLKASAIAKLSALGLSQAEIDAILK